VAGDGRGIVPPDWLGRLGNGDPDAFARCTVPDSCAGADGYANQWWRCDGRVEARGIHGQLISADRRTSTVVTILSSWPDATDRALEAAHRALVARVCDRLAQVERR
jgi:CubicO group peptidase (beta-lactamase class C family)